MIYDKMERKGCSMIDYRMRSQVASCIINERSAEASHPFPEQHFNSKVSDGAIHTMQCLNV